MPIDGWFQLESEDGSEFFGIQEDPGHRANATRIAFRAVNVAEVAPAGTRTDGGTVRAVVRLLARATLDPPAGAAWDSVTVQVVTARAMRLVLPQASELIESAAVIAIVTDFEDPLSVAVRFAL